MARGINEVMFLGNLGKDPESKMGKNNQVFVKFPLAVNETYYADGHQHETTEWFNCIAFDAIADHIVNSIKKGAEVLIKGRLHTEIFENDDGTRKHYTTVNIKYINFLSGFDYED